MSQDRTLFKGYGYSFSIQTLGRNRMGSFWK